MARRNRLPPNRNTNQDELQAIAADIKVARREVRGSRSWGAFGKVTTGGAVDQNIVWPITGVSAVRVPNAVGVQMEVVSSSANDTDGGTGIRKVYIAYLDVDLNEQAEEVTLNGTTPVPTVATDIRFVNDIVTSAVGSGAKAAGTIDVRGTGGGTVFGRITTGENSANGAFRRVPAGKRFVIANLYGGSASTNADAEAILHYGSSVAQLVDDVNIGVDLTEQGIILTGGGLALQSASATLPLGRYLAVPAGVIVGMAVTTDKAATVTAGFTGWLEDE